MSKKIVIFVIQKKFMKTKSKLGLIKKIKLNWFGICPECGTNITSSWYSFLDMKYVCKCDKCGSMYR